MVDYLARAIRATVTFLRQARVFSHRKLDTVYAHESVSLTASPSNIPDLASSVFRSTLDSSSDRYIEIGGVSYRGIGHFASGHARQDSFSIFRLRNQAVLTVADGVSSANKSHIGSGFATLNLEKAMAEVFDSEITGDLSSWRRINQWVSSGLVGIHESTLRKQNLPLETDSSSRRLSAAKELATTLEVLVCDLTADSEGKYTVLYVQLAGDGTLMHYEPGQKGSALVGPTTKAKSNVVTALPICDEPAKIQHLKLSAGGYVALVTDGIGDLLAPKSSWYRDLHKSFKYRSLSRIGLSKLVVQNNHGALDDVTLVVVRMPE